MSAQTKIAVHSLSDLKNTSDDALPNYLTHKPISFTQSHFEADVRLFLGYTAVIIAGVLFYVDWKQGWEVTKPYTAPAVAVYFLLNAAFTYWIWMVEKGSVFVGFAPTGEKVRIISSTKKHTPIYNLSVTIEPTKGKSQTLEISAPFSSWFTSDGYFVAKPFQQFLASNIPPVGAQDPNNVVEEIGRGSGQAGGFATATAVPKAGSARKRKG